MQYLNGVNGMSVLIMIDGRLLVENNRLQRLNKIILIDCRRAVGSVYSVDVFNLVEVVRSSF